MSTQKVTGFPSIDKPWMKYYDTAFLQQPVPEMNIYSYLQTRTQNYPEKTAITYYGRKVSYRDLFTHINEAAKVLTAIGVKKNDRIMYLMPNIPETAYLLYGAARIGATADFIDPRPDSVDLSVSAQKVLNMFREEKCSHVVALEQCYLAMIKPIEQELKALGLKQVVLVGASDSLDSKAKIKYLQEIADFYGLGKLFKSLAKTNAIQKRVKEARAASHLKILDYSALLKQYANNPVPEIQYEKGMLAVIVHTSGTSSAKPKPIPLTHDNMNCYVHQSFGSNMPMAVGDDALHMLPYFAAYGITNVVHSGLCHVNNLIQIPEFSTSILGKLIVKYRPQTLIGAPSWFVGLANDPALQNADLSFMTQATYGGDSLDAKDEFALNSFLTARHAKCVLTKGHGMSETSGCASFAVADYNAPASIGIPLPLTTYAVVDPETKEMLRFTDDQEYLEGELIISSGCITPGILDGMTIVPRREYNGESYILTRDIARMDKNGIMTFLARSDRSITRFDGYKIKPYEVEDIIKKHPQVQYCIISPVRDEKRYGNIAMADLVLVSGAIPARDEQVHIVQEIIDKQFVSNPEVSSRQIPALFRFRKQLPLTTNSKVNYNALAQEKPTGSEVQVLIEETNISVVQITVK